MALLSNDISICVICGKVKKWANSKIRPMIMIHFDFSTKILSFERKIRIHQRVRTSGRDQKNFFNLPNRSISNRGPFCHARAVIVHFRINYTCLVVPKDTRCLINPDVARPPKVPVVLDLSLLMLRLRSPDTYQTTSRQSAPSSNRATGVRT